MTIRSRSPSETGGTGGSHGLDRIEYYLVSASGVTLSHPGTGKQEQTTFTERKRQGNMQDLVPPCWTTSPEPVTCGPWWCGKRNVGYGGRKELVSVEDSFSIPRSSLLCNKVEDPTYVVRCPLPSSLSVIPQSATQPIPPWVYWLGYKEDCSKTCSRTRSVAQPTFVLCPIPRSNLQPARHPLLICHNSESVVSFASGGQPQTLSTPTLVGFSN